MQNELIELTRKTIFDIYVKEYPEIVDFVKMGLANGETPKTISLFVQKKLGKNSATANHIWLVAEHLKSKGE